MLAIRMQRTGRSGHAQFRVIVQDSRFSPTRGRVVSYLGSYDPHTKAVKIDSTKAARYLENGAQPSDRVARLLKQEGIKLPNWVKLDEPKKRAVRKPDKRRSTAPAAPQETAETATAEPPVATEEPSADTNAADEASEPTEQTPAEEPAPENPAAEEAPEKPTTAAETSIEEASAENAPAEPTETS